MENISKFTQFEGCCRVTVEMIQRRTEYNFSRCGEYNLFGWAAHAATGTWWREHKCLWEFPSVFGDKFMAKKLTMAPLLALTAAEPQS